MKLRYLLTVAAVITTLSVKAQVLTGTVTEAGKNTRLENVFVKDIGNKQVGLSDKSGGFYIRTLVNHTLIFSLPGYVSDTLFVTDFKPKHIELKLQGIALNSVNITESRETFNPEAEYPEVYEKSKFALSPSRWFGKESRDARRLKHYFENEKEQMQIDAVFNRAFVTSIVPLKGVELDNFMSIYRPTLAFVQASDQKSMTLYVNDSYVKFKALPESKRTQSTLTQ